MWRWLRSLALIVALAAPAAASQGAAPPLAAALAAQRASDYPTAARLFGEAASVPNPIPEYALYLQADSLSRMGDRGAAAVAAQAVELTGRGRPGRRGSPRAGRRGPATPEPRWLSTAASSTATRSTGRAPARASASPSCSRPPGRARRRSGSSAASGSPPPSRSPPTRPAI